MLKFIAAYEKDHLNGISKSFHENGNLRDSGNLVLNLPDGEWNFYYPDGQLKSIRNYNAYMWWSVQWSIELQNPFWNRYALSDVYRNERSRFYESVNAVATFQEKYFPLFEFCMHHGPFISYHPNGVIAEKGNYFQGLKDGVFVEYHDNGIIKSRGAYVAGLKHGNWLQQYPSGNVRQIDVYKHGRLKEAKGYVE
jgi:antitoxin component YwqK of YwqJK toxin-antitoxin module